MMRPSTFWFLTRRGIRNLGKHWAMTIACIASLSVCMTLNTFASLAEVNVDSMVNYLGNQNETVVYLDPDCDDATAQQVGDTIAAPVEMTNVFVQIQQSVTRVGRGIVLVLMIVSVITVGSTIRLSVFARRREIEIMKYVGATNGLVTLPFVVEGLAMGLISGALTAAVTVGAYSYMVQASDGLGGVWQMIMGQALVPVSAVWPTILTYSLAGGAIVGGLGSMFSIRKHLNV